MSRSCRLSEFLRSSCFSKVRSLTQRVSVNLSLIVCVYSVIFCNIPFITSPYSPLSSLLHIIDHFVFSIKLQPIVLIPACSIAHYTCAKGHTSQGWWFDPLQRQESDRIQRSPNLLYNGYQGLYPGVKRSTPEAKTHPPSYSFSDILSSLFYLVNSIPVQSRLSSFLTYARIIFYYLVFPFALPSLLHQLVQVLTLFSVHVTPVFSMLTFCLVSSQSAPKHYCILSTGTALLRKRISDNTIQGKV